MSYILAYDFGTSGVKAVLYSDELEEKGAAFVSYKTYYPRSGFHEQAPMDWWNAFKQSTKDLLFQSDFSPSDIDGISISGHSLGAIPLDQNGALLAERVPIWSDARAGEEAGCFFEQVDEEDWYLNTGNGFPAKLYSIFKIMWYQNHVPEIARNAAFFLGTKDYINYLLTGTILTDHSYASGSGAYSLENRKFVDCYLQAAGIAKEQLPEVVASTDIVGTLTRQAAEELGLVAGIKVMCGGVDNACMALGAGCAGEGETYTSLGSSAWIAVSSKKPILDSQTKPYVFVHCVPGMNVSSTAIFSAGSTFRWLRDFLYKNNDIPDAEKENLYSVMTAEAALSTTGANGLIFNPTLAGGSNLDKSIHARGAISGLTLGHTSADVIRAAMEGIVFNLRIALDVLRKQNVLADEMLLLGGGSKSELWRQIFADIFQMDIITTNVGQNAGALGAAVVAAVGLGMLQDFGEVKALHRILSTEHPQTADKDWYDKMFPLYQKLSDFQSDMGLYIDQLLSGA